MRPLYIIQLFSVCFFLNVSGDSFKFNSYNNHGSVGLINIPTARFFNESIHGITIYDGTPDQKITLTSSPFDWMEASFFYTNLQNRRYCLESYDPVCSQDYKDKGFNVKIRLKSEDNFIPAIAIGLNDLAGTGLYSSEYIVGSYGYKRMDFHFGLGWGTLNDSVNNISNPLTFISDSFKTRPTNIEGKGGKFQPGRYFSSEEASPFFGLTYSPKNNIILKLERDTTSSTFINHESASSNFSFGMDYSINDNFVIGFSSERGIYNSLRFVYKNNPKSTYKKSVYNEASYTQEDSKYTKLIKNLEENGIGVNKISETTNIVGLELTQFVHPNIGLVEEIIRSSARDAGITKAIKKDIKIADLNAYSDLDESFKRNAKTIYERDTSRSFNTFTGARFRPFIASREEFFKGAFLIENDTELILQKNLFFNINLKYSLVDNFDDLRIPPVDTFPAQVRSDVKDYYRNMDNGVLLGRAQIDYHLSPKTNHHIMVTGGVLEDMFSGYGMEYLYYDQYNNYALGAEIFYAYKRDYNWGLGHLDYKNLTYNLNFYLRNYGSIPFDMKISAGEYLAGDIGSTIEFSRTYFNGVKFGVFATFTDVSTEDFGEGSFDKGIFFNIPIAGNLVSYTWRPLTKDPGAKLIRRNSLYDLLVRFSPIN